MTDKEKKVSPEFMEAAQRTIPSMGFEKICELLKLKEYPSEKKWMLPMITGFAAMAALNELVMAMTDADETPDGDKYSFVLDQSEASALAMMRALACLRGQPINITDIVEKHSEDRQN